MSAGGATGYTSGAIWHKPTAQSCQRPHSAFRANSPEIVSDSAKVLVRCSGTSRNAYALANANPGLSQTQDPRHSCLGIRFTSGCNRP